MSSGRGEAPKPLLALLAPEVRIVNVVVTARLRHKVDLRSVQSVFPNAELKDVPCEALVIQLKRPKTSLMVYGSGKVLCLGARSVKSAKRAIQKLVNLLRGHGIFVKRPLNVEVHNVVAEADLQAEVDLERAARVLGPRRAIYEPDQFPGLIYRPENHKHVRALIFHTGKIIVSGARSEEEAREVVQELVYELRTRELLYADELCAVRIWLPGEAVMALQELVDSGRFVSVDDAVCQAVRDLLTKHSTLPDGGSQADELPSYFQDNPWLDILVERGRDRERPPEPGNSQEELLRATRLEDRRGLSSTHASEGAGNGR